MPTEEEINNLSSSMRSLTKQMEKMSAQQLIQNKNIDEQRSSFEDIIKSSKGLEKSYEEQGNLLQRSSKYLGDIGEKIKDSLSSAVKMGSTLSSIGTTMFAANLIKDMVELDDKMTALSVRMGKGHSGIKQLKRTVTDLQEEFGTSYENAALFVEELSKEKYVGNIKEAAAGIDLFSRASDVSSASILELTNNLSKSGGLGTDSINSIYASMVKTQQLVGISDKGMKALVDKTNDMAMNMVAFGKTEAEIKKMVTGTTALVGAMENVGISASKSTQLVEQLMDPDRIEENILLYSQLGISMEDAMSGSIDESQLGPQFKEMADRIMEMGPIAGSKFARSMNLSYKEVSKMAKLEADDIAGVAEKTMTPEEQALETMKSLEEATEGIGKKFEVGFNKIEGKVKNLPVLFLGAISFLGPWLINKTKKLFHKIINKKDIQATVDTAIVPSLTNGIKKVINKKDIQATVNTAIVPSLANGVKKVTEKVMGANKVVGNAIVSNMEMVSNKIYKSNNDKISSLMKKISKGSFADRFYRSSKQNLLDGIAAQKEELEAAQENILATIEEAGGSSIIDNISGKLKIDESSFSGTNEQLKALKLLSKEYNKLNLSQKTLDRRAEEIDTKAAKKANLEKAIANLEATKAEKEASSERALELEKKKNELIIENARILKEAEGLGDAAETAALKQSEALDEQINQLKADIIKANDETKDLEESINNLEEAKKQANDAIVEEEKKPEKSIGWFGKMKEGVKNKASDAFYNTAWGKNVAEANNGRGGFWKGTAKTAGLGTLKVIGKTLKGVLKSIGPMAIVMKLVGSFLSRIQEPLESLFDTVVDQLTPILDQIMPNIENLVDAIAKNILPPMLKIAASILTVVHWILDHTLIPILNLLGHLPGIGKIFQSMSSTLSDATGPKVTEALQGVAKNLEENGARVEESSERVADSVEEQSEGPKAIYADGASFYSNGYSSPSAQASERMTSTTTYTQESNKSEDALNNAKAERKENEKNEKIEKINSNSGFLPSIFKVLEEIKDFLMNNDENILSSEPNIASIENIK